MSRGEGEALGSWCCCCRLRLAASAGAMRCCGARDAGHVQEPVVVDGFLDREETGEIPREMESGGARDLVDGTH